jgi:PKD repeat protein
MVRRGLAFSSLFAGLAACALSACHTRTVTSDGGPDAGSGDAAASDAPGALALDFAATGCARRDAGATSADGGVAPCTGAAPLTLTFTPVSSPALTRFRWTFGDDSPPSSERAPTHTYVLPGVYDVGVVAAEDSGGSVSRQHPGFVAVAANAAGSPCDVDAQCAKGLFCLCGESAPCGDGFPHGICTSACKAGSCGASAACARVDVPPRTPPGVGDAGAPGAPEAGGVDAGGASDADAAGSDADAPSGDASVGDAGDADAGDDGASDADVARSDADAPSGDASAGDAIPNGADASAAGVSADAAPPSDAQTPGADAGRPPPVPLCLATCDSDGDCATGLVCRPLPGAAAGTWENVCVPPLYRPLADSCRDADGHLDDHVCSTGLCADLGAIGLCSASCAGGGSCPTGAACATFGDGRSLCLLTCAIGSCKHDPLLACESGSGSGALGFTTSPPTPTATFCAPRSCTSQADCAPSGTCKPLGVGAHCVAN